MGFSRVFWGVKRQKGSLFNGLSHLFRWIYIESGNIWAHNIDYTIKVLRVPFLIRMLSTSLIDLEKDTLENYIGINSDKSHIKDKWVFRGYKI